MSVLPPQEKSGEIKFFVMKSLPYRQRMLIVGAALAGGLALQLVIGFWPGFALMFFGALMGMNSGYNSSPQLIAGEEWARVTPNEYEKVIQKAEELRAWDEDLFDGTNTLGVVGFAVAMALLAGAYFAADMSFGFPPEYWLYFGLDALTLLVPLWFVGTRDYLKKDRLIVKIEALKRIMEALQGNSEVQVQPMLALAATKAGGKEPEDARLMIKILGAPKDFYGIQAQVSINSVQGKDYPYLYCVLIAKAGSGLLANSTAIEPQPEIGWLDQIGAFLVGGKGGGTGEMTYEASNSGDVDIIVARQLTTRTSGYYTQPSAARSVVECSLKLAKTLLQINGSKAV